MGSVKHDAAANCADDNLRAHVTDAVARARPLIHLHPISSQVHERKWMEPRGRLRRTSCRRWLRWTRATRRERVSVAGDAGKDPRARAYPDREYVVVDRYLILEEYPDQAASRNIRLEVARCLELRAEVIHDQ